MKIDQLYTKCLAQGAYFISSGSEAAIVDPLRDIDEYLKLLEENNLTLRYIFETHYHADFVSGHYDLQRKTGATIIYGPNAKASADVLVAADGQQFRLGDVKIELLHTPGHTMESSCYLLKDNDEKAHAVFTGDTLFIGDVGRPDLAQKASGLTQEKLAVHLYHSLRSKLMTLDDAVVVYPGHGAGSACGKKMSDETVSTIGAQKKTNYAFQEGMSEEQFIKEVLSGLTRPPAYFGMNVKMNKEGYGAIHEVMGAARKSLGASAFKKLSKKALILDTRDQESFAEGHVPGSINIGLKGGFAPWVGAVLKDVNQDLLLITDQGDEQEAVIRLSRVGFDHVLGFLEGGVEAWLSAGEALASVKRIDADSLTVGELNHYKIVDVRKSAEFNAGHLQDGNSYPLSQLDEFVEELASEQKPLLIHCAGGYRSMIAASFLMRQGITNFIEVRGGYKALEQTNLNKIEGSCQNTL